MTPKTYNDEFKAAAAKLVREQGYSASRRPPRASGVDPGSIRDGSAASPPAVAPPRRLGRGTPPREPPPPRGEPQAPHGARDFKKSDGLLREGAAVKFAFIRDHQARVPRRGPLRRPRGLAQRLLRLDATGRRARRPPRRDRLVGQIREVHGESRADLRLAARLPGPQGPGRRLLREHRGQADEGRRASAPRPGGGSWSGPPTAGTAARWPPNVLDREFYPDRPDAVWAADITYVPTGRGLAVPGGGDRPVLAAGRGLGDGRPPAEPSWPATRCGWPWSIAGRAAELLHHSDRGVQYASEAYQGLLAGHGIEPSMSRTGNCWDNAVMESFFSTLKRELTHHETLRHPRGGAAVAVRVHRGVLQPPAPAFDARLSQPGRVRGTLRILTPPSAHDSWGRSDHRFGDGPRVALRGRGIELRAPGREHEPRR